MKIVAIAPETFPVPPIRGGAIQTWIDETSRRLEDEEITILGIKDPSLPLRDQVGTMEHRRFAEGFWTRLATSSYKLPTKQKNSLWYQLPYSWWAAQQVRELKPDIVHLHSAKAGWLGRLVAHESHNAMIYSPHAFPFLRRTARPLRALYRFAERLGARNTDLLLAVSELTTRGE